MRTPSLKAARGGRRVSLPAGRLCGHRRNWPLCRLAFAMAAFQAAASFAQPGPAIVSLAPAVERLVTPEKQFVATIQPSKTSVVGSAVEGRVMEIAVEEGDRVAEGQRLAQLRTRTLEAELAAAKAELALRRQEFLELENGSRPEEIAQAQAAMLADQARMEYAKKDLARIQRLYKESTAADDEYDEAVSRAAETEQEFLEAKAAYDLVVQGPRKERIEQARAKMEQQQFEVERLEDILSKYTVSAPFDGYVTAKRTEVGAWIMAGQPVVEVNELQQVDAVALVPEDYVSRLTIGMQAIVHVPSLAHETFVGTVAFIVPQADTRSRSFPVKVRIQNRESRGHPLLKGGLFAEVGLAVGEPARALLVSKDAIVLGGAEPTLFIYDSSLDDAASGTVRQVTVKLGLSSAGLIEVLGPIAAGDKVVVRGNERLSPGQPVRVSEVLEVPAETSNTPGREAAATDGPHAGS